ncbi:hypothetical protein Ae201684P_014507 [Aphanomyces euteiches]|uniref:Protein kinase domain-containing protein n=1 Tax=Aphanomyces euteiches TaxID=100861 RepID=A0A6G0WAQ3_9STRA|nr:hypothetical protein Ae201684_017696 [Aphanomyces euteiches]KAH9095437.1 hypothetical protein Ae201684P_014507 [Aphanomyces euteiches]KAH9139567.1 hypothetical protein AeRB84_016157 [Aphanomyces euteiches]
MWLNPPGILLCLWINAWIVSIHALRADSSSCDALNQTYQSQYDTCKNASNGVGYANARAWCAIKPCADTILKALDRKNNGCALELTCLPLNFCSDACINALEAYQKGFQKCDIVLQAFTLDNCKACQTLFGQRQAFESTCQVQVASPQAYVIELHNTLGDQLDVCVKGFPNVAFDFPSANQPATTSKSSTMESLGWLAAFMTLTIVGLVVYRKWKKMHHAQSVLTQYDPYSSPSLLGDTKEVAKQDIRFDPSMAKYRVPLYEIVDMIVVVKGGNGVVHRATLRGQTVAIKQLLPSKAKNPTATSAFMAEIRLYTRLDHAKIVAFVGIAWSTLLDLSLLTEWMPFGDLSGILEIERNKQVEDRQFHWHGSGSEDLPTTKLNVALDVAYALQYLHWLPLIHRDIKSKNILMSAKWEAKVSDFGISRRSTFDETMTGNVGTVAWIAPEVLCCQRYTTKADIYSFGVFLSELDTVEHPYASCPGKVGDENSVDTFSKARIALLVSQGQLQPAFTTTIPSKILDLAKKCLSFQEDDRPTAEAVIQALLESLVV